ncbi:MULTISPECIES: cytochrome c oxidase subunit 3 [unclassified Rhizobium]|uniref:cytochrome c oxidase subunit 3 n=1 Tax=unclassified Rhizobium TaxID=2613769 RepID=UPI001616BC24|nr:MULTISPECIES: cytochrome c oxidase subunit 3 [unclassified Rhizobium]MBB3318272.1 heme/copper-type cytochrome/quinol oxidase subunit 3 [Rhizobium sp. BK181]MCS4094077.1 heme/copper-type cytochrome/quinol oxidase subunit 3 [Rhizobium sp. BK176]
MRDRIVLDTSNLPLHGMGMASPTWWATCAFMLIEGTGFALGIAVYFYLMGLAPVWPIDAPPPDLQAGTWLTAILLASVVPNVLLSRWAERKQIRRVQIGLILMTILGIIPLPFRVFEFYALHTMWDQNAYGSIVWTLLGLHTTHIVTDLADTVVLTCLMFTRHGNNTRRFGDVQDNALYWNFVVLIWLPIYGCIYWVPRL